MTISSFPEITFTPWTSPFNQYSITLDMARVLAKPSVQLDEYGEKVSRPKHGPFIPPPGFEESPFPFSIPDCAQTVYRADRPTDSIQIRVYENRVTYQLDRYNPHYHPVQHAVYDAPGYTFLALAAGAALAGSGGS